jgi:thiol:disulfide interchange protein DsbA
MPMSVRLSALALTLLGWSSLSFAEVQAGQDYTVLRPAQATDNPAKVEVIQFFSYGCPHCAEMHHMVDQWQAKLPRDVVFKRVPVSFGRPLWASLARMYYALQTTGDLEKLDGAVYEAVQKGVPLNNDQAIMAWIRTKGVDTRKFAAALNSFDVSRNVSGANRMTQEYDVDGVPFFVVNGKYAVIGKSYEQMLDVTSELIAKARKEGPATSKAASAGENPARSQRASPAVRLVQ